MAHPSAVEAEELARADAVEAIAAARSGGPMQPIVGIADGADHDARATGFHKHWWAQHDGDWPADVREAYTEAFTRALLAAKVAVVELEFDTAGGKWTNVGVVDLERWEPTFPFDPESTGWIRQDPRSRVGWRRRSALRKLFSRKQKESGSASLVALVCLGLVAAPAHAGPPPPAEEPIAPLGFKLAGTHGYSITGEGFAGETGSRGFFVLDARRGRETVSYRVPAKVTANSIRADLGGLGRVDLVLNPSGHQDSFDSRCLRHQETFEGGTWEGVVEFAGEGKFTSVGATRTAALPYLALLSQGRFCEGENSGEARGPNLPGARLAGVSYADGRILKFQLNKNRARGKTLFKASLAERRGGIRILRELSGVAPPRAFRFGPSLRSATVSPPAPFSGTAKLTRNRDSVSPLLRGDLRLAFPGHTVGLDGQEVHVSLVHAHFAKGEDGSVGIGYRLWPWSSGTGTS